MRALLPISVLAVLTAACGPKNTSHPTLVTNEAWCPDGFESGPSDTCFAIPDKHDASTPVLVYLHGMYAGHGSAEEWALVRSAVDRGFAVVVPRGKRGACAWKAELKDHFCWPQEVDDPAAFKHVVAEWDRVLWQVDALLEAGTHKRYVLGYSNGGFFATYLAVHGIFPAQGYAIVNGGSLEPSVKAAKAPMLLVAAQEDPDQGPKMKALHESLGAAPHAYCTRPGSHPLAASDVEASLRFFRHQEGKAPAFACEPSQKEAGKAAPAPPPPPAPSAFQPNSL